MLLGQLFRYSDNNKRYKNISVCFRDVTIPLFTGSGIWNRLKVENLTPDLDPGPES